MRIALHAAGGGNNLAITLLLALPFWPYVSGSVPMNFIGRLHSIKSVGTGTHPSRLPGSTHPMKMLRSNLRQKRWLMVLLISACTNE